MSKSKERNTCRGHKFTYRIVSQSAYEGRSFFKAGALMGAVGLSLSAVIAAAPLSAVNAKTVNLDTAASAAYVEEISDTDFFFKDDSLVNFTVEDVTELDALVEATLKNEDAASKIRSCTSKIPEEEAQQKLSDIQKEEEQQAKISSANVPSYSSDSTDYVRLNTDGRAMSEKQAPDWLELDENGIPVDYAYCITGKSTAYYSGYVTSTGTAPVQGTVAVDPREIPYGTKMYITSADGRYIYGYAVAEDTGGFIYFSNGATVDLYMHSYSDCVNWGWRSVNIYVLN